MGEASAAESTPDSHLTTRAEASEWEEEPEDYFDGFENAGTALRVEPEAIYQGVLRRYYDAYQHRDEASYVSIEDELADPEIAAKLEATCGHNLVFTRYLLEAWRRKVDELVIFLRRKSLIAYLDAT